MSRELARAMKEAGIETKSEKSSALFRDIQNSTPTEYDSWVDELKAYTGRTLKIVTLD